MFAIAGSTVESPWLKYLGKVVPIAVAREHGLDDAAIERNVRLASNCVEHQCGHFDGAASACSLAKAVNATMPEVVEAPPPCAIRKDCVWWHQEGVSICRRCPSVARRTE